MADLKDQLGRTIDNLRISVTDRCNFRCVYCMPEEGLEWVPHERILSFEEIARLARIACGLGIRKIRLTGGEPLVRKDLHILIGLLGEVSSLADLSLTTNGLLLGAQAARLSAAGLRRINVSLDSLVRETFQRLARRDALDQVMASLEVAGRFFPGPIKVNAVLLRGVNDHEVEAFAELARRQSFEVRFIEFMPLDADRIWSRESLVSGEEVRERIGRVYPLVPDPLQAAHAPSRDYVFRDGRGGKIGFINSVTEPFCDRCNRIRITADGKLRTCLFSLGETDLLALLRGESPDAEIAEVIRRATWAKEPGHKINGPDFVRSARTMSQIGG
jgi:cyclic pyranopterin phosphate synthase